MALSEADITYPISELGNCETKQACFAYCDDTVHLNACLSFADQHNLMSQGELTKARKFQSVGAVGPGGCTSERQCKTYCENVNNIEECLSFAQQHGFMEEEELAEAKKVQAALQAGAQLPGGCTGKSSCEAYCSDMNHMRECIAFAETAGFMSPEELREAKQVLKALDAGLTLPGNCRGERECDVYCQDENHAQECVEFALAAGFIPPEEADEARKMMSLMREGKMPKACRQGKEACEAYCSDPENTQECTTFFIEAGFMTPEEAEMFKKTGGKGPGDCKGEKECNAYCNNPANQEACFAFASEHGLIPEEELGHIREGVGRFKEGISSAPPEVAQCLRDKIGQDVLSKIEAGTFLPNPQLGETMKACFEDFFSQQQHEGGFPEGEGFGPPPGFEQGFDREKSPEQVACMERILGDLNQRTGPPTPDQERRLAQECFGGGEQFFPGSEEQGFPPQQFEGEHPQGEFNQQFQEQFQQQFEQQFQQEAEQQFQQEFERQRQEEIERQFQERQQFQEGQEQTGPPPTHSEGGLSPEDIQRIEQQEAAALQFQQQQGQAEQQRLEQELQQQFQELQQLQQQLQDQQPPAGGSVLDVFLYFLRPLLPR